jgi:hypothetical protein
MSDKRMDEFKTRVKDVKFTHPEDHVPDEEVSDYQDILRPTEAPGDVPDIGGEFTTAGVSKEHWEHPEKRETHGT